MQYNQDFQRAILFYMFKDGIFCQKCCSFLEQNFFTGELKWFFGKINDLFEQTQKPPKEGDLEIEVLKQGADAPKFEEERKIILSSKNAEHHSFAYIKRELTGYARANLFISNFREVQGLFNSGNQEDAYAITQKRMVELSKTDFEDSNIIGFGDYDKVCDLAAEQAKNAIPTGIYFIDDALGGGMFPQTWTTFIGGANIGKSFLCPNLAYHAAQRRKKTFITVHEDEENPTKLRYLSRFSGIPINYLMRPRMSWSKDIEKLVKVADEKLNEFVRMKFMYGKDCSLEKVMDTVRFQKIDNPFDLYICDYGQCLKSSGYRRNDDRYGLHEYIYFELKQLCLELNIAGCGGAQANRAGHKEGLSGSSLLRATSVGDSWGIVKKASNVITMTRSNDDMRNNRMIFLLDKARSGRCPVGVECETDFTRAVTHVVFAENRKTQQEIPVTDDSKRADIDD